MGMHGMCMVGWLLYLHTMICMPTTRENTKPIAKVPDSVPWIDPSAVVRATTCTSSSVSQPSQADMKQGIRSIKQQQQAGFQTYTCSVRGGHATRTYHSCCIPASLSIPVRQHLQTLCNEECQKSGCTGAALYCSQGGPRTRCVCCLSSTSPIVQHTKQST